MTRKKIKIRVATAGPTIDGREIKAEDLREMAATYNPALYTARLFVEHVRGFSVDSGFPACGDVTGVEVKDEGGKTVMYADIEANENLIKLNAKDQKVFPSIEIVRDFASTGKSYLGGLGVTDTPASTGTQRITFSANAQRADGSGIYRSQGDGIALAFEADDEFKELKNWFKELFSGAKSSAPPAPPAPSPAPEPSPTPAPQNFNADTIAAAVSAQIMKPIGDAFAKSADALQATAEKVDALANRIAAVEQHNATTDGNSSHRPVATGGEEHIY